MTTLFGLIAAMVLQVLYNFVIVKIDNMVNEMEDNSNLGAETTPDTVRASTAYAEAVAEAAGLPLVLTTVEESLYDALKEEIPNLFSLTLQHNKPF